MCDSEVSVLSVVGLCVCDSVCVTVVGLCV